MFCFKKDVSWVKIKAFNIAFKPLCCKCTQKVVIMWVLLGFWGSKVLPLFKQFKVYGTWQLASPNSYSLYSEEMKTKTSRRSEAMSKKHDKTFSKTQKATCGLLPCEKSKCRMLKRPRLTAGCLKDEALKQKSETSTLFKSLSRVVSCVYLLNTTSKLALVN